MGAFTVLFGCHSLLVTATAHTTEMLIGPTGNALHSTISRKKAIDYQW